MYSTPPRRIIVISFTIAKTRVVWLPKAKTFDDMLSKVRSFYVIDRTN